MSVEHSAFFARALCTALAARSPTHLRCIFPQPDDAFSSVPYEKGCVSRSCFICLHACTVCTRSDFFLSLCSSSLFSFNFLTYVESLVGGEEVMNPFLRAHCEKFAHSTVNAEQWKEFMIEYFTNTAKVDKEKLAQIDWDTSDQKKNSA